MQSLREKLWGKTKPLRERLAQIGTGALAVASGRVVPMAIAATAAKVFPDKETDEEKAEREAKGIENEVMGQIDLNARMGWHSDKDGNQTTRIEGYDQEAAMKAPPRDPVVKSQSQHTLEALPGAMLDTVKKGYNLVTKGRVTEHVKQTASAAEELAQEILPEPEKAIDLSTTVAPKEYHGAISRGLQHINRFVTTTDPSGRQYAEINPEEIVNLFNAENGGSWSPTTGNKNIDYGVSQLNIAKRKDLRDTKTIWGSSWKQNFQEEYGPFDEDNPEHQVLGGVIVYAYARQKLTDLFKSGKLKREPTQEDFIVAYNMDAKQVADAINGENYNITVTNNSGAKVKKSLQKQYNDYLNYVRQHATSTQSSPEV